MDINQEVSKNEKLIYRVINDLQFIPDKVDREDLEQIGRIALWESLKSYDEYQSSSLGNYCYFKIKSAIIDYLRKSIATKRKDIHIDEPYSEGIEYELMDGLLIEEIGKYIPEQDKNIFLDKHLNKMTLEGISNKYDLSIKQVRNRLEKAKTILQNNLIWEE